MSVKFAIFDLDGTLVDSKYDLTDAVNHTREIYGLKPLTVETVAGYLGSGIPALVHAVLPELEEPELSRAVSEFKLFYSNHLLDKTKPYTGIVELLENISDIKKAVLSNKTENFTRQIIEELGLKKYFSAVYGGDSFKEKKPNPLPVNKIIEMFSVKKEDVIMIGDGANDVNVGKNAGIKTIGVLYGYSSKERIDSLQPSYIAQNPYDILNIVRSI